MSKILNYGFTLFGMVAITMSFVQQNLFMGLFGALIIYHVIYAYTTNALFAMMRNIIIDQDKMIQESITNPPTLNETLEKVTNGNT